MKKKEGTDRARVLVEQEGDGAAAWIWGWRRGRDFQRPMET